MSAGTHIEDSQRHLESEPALGEASAEAGAAVSTVLPRARPVILVVVEAATSPLRYVGDLMYWCCVV